MPPKMGAGGPTDLLLSYPSASLLRGAGCHRSTHHTASPQDQRLPDPHGYAEGPWSILLRKERPPFFLLDVPETPRTGQDKRFVPRSQPRGLIQKWVLSPAGTLLALAALKRRLGSGWDPPGSLTVFGQLWGRGSAPFRWAPPPRMRERPTERGCSGVARPRTGLDALTAINNTPKDVSRDKDTANYTLRSSSQAAGHWGPPTLPQPQGLRASPRAASTGINTGVEPV